MKCERCGGFTIAVSFSGGETAIGAWTYAGWKCLNCGCVTDPLIRRNRIAQSQRPVQPNSILRASRVDSLYPADRGKEAPISSQFGRVVEGLEVWS